MSGKSRAPGEREPTGMTKSAILLFLADNGECTFTQIRNHLREHHNIKSARDVKLHLQGLVADDRLGLLTKASHGNGNANSYSIRSSFASLKKLHNFLREHGAVPALMKTRYFREISASPEFMLKVRIRIMANSLLDLNDYIMDDAGYARLIAMLRDVTDEDRKAIIGWMERIRDGDRDDAQANEYFSMMEQIARADVDMVFEKGLERMRSEGIIEMDETIRAFDRFTAGAIIPENRRETVSTILRLSPGALDYVLNARGGNPLFPPNVFLVYYCDRIVQSFREFVEPGSGTVGGGATIDFSTYQKYTALLPSYSSEPPIVLVARSLFVADMVHGRLAVDKVPEETLRLIFST